ncbi:Spermidine/putrescine import ATP-binding protein PotA [Pelotomaculum sp. FP]|uniref:ABC transporter ATP-binding protein n=1 Tax=Pelotomaculum sp. FP TaxID=261474 RepID=UPI0010654945|nr:ABC transporter ATP-binding protein [Pelotomaculum sp. FP]TEB12859.1 Spermidine/putrescine import ATP-binding protein PotA [Pelotomaculum sp. FP]
MSNNNIIEVKNLNLTKGRKKILDIEYFSLEEGEAVALIGPNGAGKSTFMQVLMLLQRPTGGELFFKGDRVDWKKPIAYRRRMAMVFQEPLLLDTTVYHNVASGLKLRGFKVDTIPARVSEWLGRLGIAHLAERQARYLSGGESQRVSLARALVLEPEVLFLDEPFVALDVPTRAALTAELARILRDTRITSVFVTHDYSEVPLLAETVTVLEQGRIIQKASPREIMTRPVSRTVASLVGVENMIPGKVVGTQDGVVLVQAGPHRLKSLAAVPVGTNVLILLRPEDIKIFKGVSRHGDNSFGGKVSGLLPHNYLYKAVIDCGFPVIAFVNPEQVMGGEVLADNEITVQFSPDKVHLIKQ